MQTRCGVGERRKENEERRPSPTHNSFWSSSWQAASALCIYSGRKSAAKRITPHFQHRIQHIFKKDERTNILRAISCWLIFFLIFSAVRWEDPMLGQGYRKKINPSRTFWAAKFAWTVNILIIKVSLLEISFKIDLCKELKFSFQSGQPFLVQPRRKKNSRKKLSINGQRQQLRLLRS